MQEDLIIDVGMHRGRDTEFYLAKGFRVAAVEANPELVRQVEQSLSAHVANGRLRIFNVAVADYTGTTTFWLNEALDDWGTTSAHFAELSSAGGKIRQITVSCKPFGHILDECGTPYYLKIDIEGSDLLCIEALRGREAPAYVSLESPMYSFEETFTQLSTLWTLGYRKFKIVNQGLNEHIRCPEPPREGRYVDARFDWHCSGPFGEETPGRWLSADEVLTASRRLTREQQRWGRISRRHGSLLTRCYHRLRRFQGTPIAWYDLHAKLGTTSGTR